MTAYTLASNKSIYSLNNGDTLTLLPLKSVTRGQQFFILVSGTATLIQAPRDQINYSTSSLAVTAGQYILISAGPGASWYVLASNTTGSGSEVTSIIAGTNVTIDPVGGTGDVTISSSGGGGSVDSVTGTAGQIDATPTTGDVILSLVDNVRLPGTDSLGLVSGTTAERSGTPVDGDLRFNSTLGFAEYYNSIVLSAYGGLPFIVPATGGGHEFGAGGLWFPSGAAATRPTTGYGPWLRLGGDYGAGNTIALEVDANAGPGNIHLIPGGLESLFINQGDYLEWDGTANFRVNSIVEHTVLGSVSGSLSWVQAEDKTYSKKIIIVLADFNDAGEIITFDTPFGQAAGITGNTTGLSLSSPTTTTFTLGVTSGESGVIVIEGY